MEAIRLKNALNKILESCVLGQKSKRREVESMTHGGTTAADATLAVVRFVVVMIFIDVGRFVVTVVLSTEYAHLETCRLAL